MYVIWEHKDLDKLRITIKEDVHGNIYSQVFMFLLVHNGSLNLHGSEYF